jgi:hypothetical protein
MKRRSLGETLLLLRIYAFVIAVPCLVRLRLPLLAAILEPRRVPPAPDEKRAEAVVSATDRVLRSGRPFIRTGCLTRGLTLFYFLRRAGVDVALLFGVGEIDGKPAGHCWIVRGGEPFLEEEDPRPHFTEVWGVTPGATIAAC